MSTQASTESSETTGVRSMALVLPAGFRLATVGETGLLYSGSPVLIYDNVMAAVYPARVRGFTGEGMRVIADRITQTDWTDLAANLDLVDDDLEPLPATAFVTDGRYYLVAVTR